MKWILACAGALALTSCNVVVGPNPGNRLEVLEATYRTDTQLSDGTFIICDNRDTVLTYTFRYRGELEAWRSYLQGDRLREIKGDRVFTPTSEGVTPFESGYEVTYSFGANFAPLKDGEATPQDIIVVPTPTPIGGTKLHVILQSGSGATAEYDSPSIPVYASCG